MMDQDYWNGLRRERVSRRRLMRGAAAGGAGLALALAGCGGRQNTTSTTNAPSGGPSAAPPAPSAGKPGGTAHQAGGINGTPPTLDPYKILSFLTQNSANFVYSRIVKYATGPGIDPIDYTKYEGDLAASWEQPDPMTYVFHIRPNVKFQNVAPLNGRPLTADDIQFSVQRQAEDSQDQAAWTNVVDHVETPDDRTMRVALKGTYAPFLNLMAEPSHLRIVPKEMLSAGLAEKPIGTGPFIFDRLDKDVVISFKKNPDYFIAGHPLVDAWNAALVHDDSTIIAGLKTGSFDVYINAGSANYPTIKSQVPDAQFVIYGNPSADGFNFNFDNKPWGDARVRQALSMAIDRAGIMKALDPTPGNKGGWETAVGQLTPWWLDPQGSEFGPNAKYFKRDLGEAKKLLAAAGYPDGIECKCYYTQQYGQQTTQMIDLLSTTAKDAGFRFSLQAQEYAAYLATSHAGKIPDSTGLSVGPLKRAEDPDDIFSSIYEPGSARRNWEGSGPDTPAADSQLLQMFKQQRTELDYQKRLAIVKDLQRYMAEKMYVIPWLGFAQVQAYRPYFKNFYYKDSYGVPTESWANVWLDK